MIASEVKDITCGHCVNIITSPVKAADKDAKVQIDLASHRVRIEPTKSNTFELSDAIKEAGYTPVAIAGAPNATAKAACKNAGCEN